MARALTLVAANYHIRKLEEEVAALKEASFSQSNAGNTDIVAGERYVADPRVTSTSVVFLTRKTLGGTIGNLSYTLSPGSGFVIHSSEVADTSVVSYHISY